MTTRNLTIMFTDIKGFTSRVSDGNREYLKTIRALHDRLLTPVFRHFEGNIIKTIGDSFLVTFDSPTDAVMCGVTIQEVLRQHNLLAAEDKKLEVKVAINSGDVEVADSDVLGEPVNIAARLEGIAEPGDVYFTESVYLSMNRNEAPSSEIGERTFKGIPYPIKVYKTILEPETELSKRLAKGVEFTEHGPVIKGIHHGKRKKRSLLIPAGAAVSVLIAVLLWQAFLSNRSEQEITKANQALKDKRPITALEILDPLLMKTPENTALSALAVKAANTQIEHLIDSQSTETALEWLTKQLEDRTYLEPLRTRIPTLDAKAVADRVVQKNRDAKWRQTQIDELLQRYPDNPLIPYLTARSLQGKIYFTYPLGLYEEALARGVNPDETIFAYCTALFEKMFPGQVRKAHEIIMTHYTEKGVEWARRVLDEDASGNHLSLDNAWHILMEIGDPRTETPYFISILKLADGYPGGTAVADESIKIFLRQDDSFRRKQIITLARKRVNYRSGYMREVERTLEELEKNWNLQ